MKKFIIITMLFIGGITLSGCFDLGDSDPGPTYWYSFATLYQDNSTIGYHFTLDSGEDLIASNSLSLTDFDDTARVIVTYDIDSVSGIAPSMKITAKIITIEGILTKDIIQLTPEIEDSIGNDQVYIGENAIWMTENHLNIIFEYLGYNKVHYINLTKPIGEQTDAKGNQILEFRHNSNDDYKQYNYESVVSFRMDSLYQAGLDSIKFVVRAIDGDTFNYEYYGTFHFNDTTDANASADVILPMDEYNKLIE